MFLLVSSNIFLHATSAQNTERLKAKAETLLNAIEEVNATMTDDIFIPEFQIIFIPLVIILCVLLLMESRRRIIKGVVFA